MSNTSFSKVGELMSERTADTRSAKPASGDGQTSRAAVQRFEQLLQTATTQRPHRPQPSEARRDDNRPRPVERADRQRSTSADRFDRADRPERPPSADRRTDDSNRTDERDRAGGDERSVSNARRADRRSDDRVRSDDEHTKNEGLDDSDAALEADASPTGVTEEGDAEGAVDADSKIGGEGEQVSTATDQAAGIVLDGAESAESEELARTESSSDGLTNGESVGGGEEITTEGSAPSDAAAAAVDADSEPGVDSQVAETVDSTEVEVEGEDQVEGEDDAQTGAINNAAAAQAAAAPVLTETEVEVTTEDAEAAVIVESGQTATETGSDAGADPEIAAQLQDDGSAETEASESSEVDSAEEADQSNLDGEGQPDQQPTDGGDSAEVAPVAAPAQATAVQGTAQATNTTNPIAGLTEVSATGEVGPSSSNQVAGTAPSEQADGADPLWRQVRRAMGSIRNLPTGEQQLTIRLRPDDLGSVTVRISTGESGTTVALVADSAAAASQLNQQRQQLIRELEDGGLRGVAVDVGTSGDAEQSSGDPDAELDENGRATGGTNTNGSAGDGPERAYSGRRDGRLAEGLIDVDL